MSGPHGLEPDWLNDAAKGFLPGADEHPRTVFESESLLVQVPSPEYLLAMKLHASRDDRDLDDAAILFNRLGYTTAQDRIDLLTATYPTGQLLPRHRYLADEVTTRAHAHRDRNDKPPDIDAARRGREQSRSDDGLDPFRDPWQHRPGPGREGQDATCNQHGHTAKVRHNKDPRPLDHARRR